MTRQFSLPGFYFSRMEIAELYKLYKTSPRISTDTRKDPSGTLFFCLKGDNFDANLFAEEALYKGAVHVIADKSGLSGKPGITVVDDVLSTLQRLAQYHRSTFRFPVIGLTGSNGKTTNKELIAAVLAKKYRTYFTQGNLNNHIGVPLTLLSIPTDAEMAVIEMGANHVGEIRELSLICNPDFGMITNIGKAHLEGFGGLEGVKKGKKELYDHIENEMGTVFVNSDDPVLMELSENINRITFGKSAETDVTGEQLQSTPFVKFSFHHKDYQSAEITTQLVGDYNFANLMAAVCIGTYFEVNHSEISSALESYSPGNNRSQLIDTGKNLVVMDAYNANPSSMELALRNFAEMPGAKKIVFAGHMLELGTDSVLEHQKVIDLIRSLNLRGILAGKNFETCARENLIYFPTTPEFLEWLGKEKIEGATILVKGSRMAAMEKALPYL